MKLFRSSSLGSGHHPDYVILGVSLLILLGGFLFLASASSDIGKIYFNDTLYYLKQQLLKGLIPGIMGFIIGYLLYYRRWKKVALYAFLLNLFLLVLVFTPIGREVKGSHRWLMLGPLSFQPSELLKITYVLYIASIFSSPRIRQLGEGWKTYLIFVFVSAVAGLLIFLQPATTMAIIIVGAGLVVYFLSSRSFRQVALQLALTLGVALIIVSGLALATPYRLARIAPYWNPIAQRYFPSAVIKNAANDSFHVSQSITAVGAGGITGVGFGKSTAKYSILPEPMGDSIFAVIAEEFGFVGVTILIVLFLVLFWRGTNLILKSHDDFARLTVGGFMAVIAIETIIHIASNIGLLPFTGVPLPFISYGGTALAVTLAMIGITANISRHTSLI